METSEINMSRPVPSGSDNVTTDRVKSQRLSSVPPPSAVTCHEPFGRLLCLFDPIEYFSDKIEFDETERSWAEVATRPPREAEMVARLHAPRSLSGLTARALPAEGAGYAGGGSECVCQRGSIQPRACKESDKETVCVMVCLFTNDK